MEGRGKRENYSGEWWIYIILIVVIISQKYTYVKCYHIVHLKHVQYKNSTSIKPLKIKRRRKNQLPTVLRLSDKLLSVRKSLVREHHLQWNWLSKYTPNMNKNTRISLAKNGLLSRMIIHSSFAKDSSNLHLLSGISINYMPKCLDLETPIIQSLYP